MMVPTVSHTWRTGRKGYQLDYFYILDDKYFSSYVLACLSISVRIQMCVFVGGSHAKIPYVCI